MKKLLTALALIILIILTFYHLFNSNVTVDVPNGGMEVDKDTTTVHLKTLPPATAEDKG